MTAPAERVYIYGRIRGVTRRWLQSLSAAAGVTLTRGTMTADTIVLGTTWQAERFRMPASFAWTFGGSLPPASCPSVDFGPG